ncbi:hypothetical protein QR680_006179 [Steinernema hermaphroditum]|uniref:Uncharacterized protein n=1 Tax=Steinernema hermaphroditum TaxID=289476 RepID=A0AA39HWS7_9BILA|nr:hypothetical protein QR680_006179 [Steinernema hermaphroditum]
MLTKLFLLFVLLSTTTANHMFLNRKDIIGEDYWDKLTQNADGPNDPCYRKHCPIGDKCFAIPNPKCRRLECPMTATCVNIGNAGGIAVPE